MSLSRWEALEHTSDLEVLIYGKSEEELFVNAALALMSQIVELDTVRETKNLDIRMDSQVDDPGEFFLDWLRELLYVSITRGFMICNLKVKLGKNDNRCSLEAVLRGEYVDHSRHQLLHEVKTVTYQDFFYGLEGSTWKARVVFDV